MVFILEEKEEKVKMKNELITLVFIVFLYSCSFSDYSTELGDDYIFVSESNSSQYIYNSNDSNFTQVIPCTIIEYSYDSEYILTKNRMNIDCSNSGYIDTISFYYILDKKKKLCIGPLDSNTFIIKKKQLNISINFNY